MSQVLGKMHSVDIAINEIRRERALKGLTIQLGGAQRKINQCDELEWKSAERERP